MQAYHFLSKDKKLRYGSKELVEVGKTIRVNPNKLIMCQYGLHASICIIDALQYAPGPVLCHVTLGGNILKTEDKVCASERTANSIVDISNILHEFSCRLAEQTLQDYNITDKRLWNAIEAKRQWLKGEISGKDLSAAAASATDAYYAAAANAHASAATAAADAAYAAAANAVRADAAANAAHATTTARSAQNELLESLIGENHVTNQ